MVPLPITIIHRTSSLRLSRDARVATILGFSFIFDIYYSLKENVFSFNASSGFFVKSLDFLL